MRRQSDHLPPERLGDADAIAAYLGTSSATQCPSQAAAIMGEWRPGLWREAERKAERRGGKAFRKQQRALKGHYPVKVIPAAEPDHPRFVTVTRALVDAGASGVDWKGDPVGWSHRQVAILDPESNRGPVKGWRYRSDGRQIPWSDAVAFLTKAKRKKLRPKPGSRAEAEAINTLRRLTAWKPPVGVRNQSLRLDVGIPSPPTPTPYRESQAVLVKRSTSKPHEKADGVIASSEAPPWD